MIAACIDPTAASRAGAPRIRCVRVPDAAVVIVNYRSPDHALRTARAAASAASVDELLVVDNASGDDSVRRLEREGIRVLARDRNHGFAAAANAGFAATSSPYVVLLNADAEPRQDAIDRLVQHMRVSHRVGVAAPRLVNPDGSPQPSHYRRFPGPLVLFLELSVPLGYLLMRHLTWLDPYRARSGAVRVAHAAGAALVIRRAAYDDAGPFDERFFLYLEETEWQERATRRGWTVEVVPDAEVVHLVRGGGTAAEAPSPHFVASAQRYLRLRGVSPRTVRIALGGGILSSRLGLRVIAILFPSRRATALRTAQAYDRLWAAFKGRHGTAPRPGASRMDHGVLDRRSRP
jgi:N-acetylglucosaminyl-diphospho-decaprenol L-rhamnosyltransferase